MTNPDVVVHLEPLLLDKKATCRALGDISEDKLDQLMRRGELVPRTIGRTVVFPIEEVRRFASEIPSWEPRR